MIWGRLQAFVFGGAIARAGSDAVTPVLEPVRQHAWTKNQLRVLDPGSAARLVAQAALELQAAQGEASRSGYNANRLAALVFLAQTAPGVAEALTLYRRKKITKDQLHHAFAKEQLEPQYWPGLESLAAVLLSPAEVANAIQQGHLANEGVLPEIAPDVPPPPGWKQPPSPDHQPPSHVPLTQIDLDGLAQAEHGGIDFKQLQVIANLSGLPPGPESLLAMWNRNLIDEDSVNAGIREGHMKTKWAAAFKRLRWAVLSPQDAASARLRTWITAEESYEIGAQTGHSKEQMDLLFLNRGRPASPTQMWRAWARKVKGPRGVPVEYEDHAKAIAISDIRPEYAEMLWGIRFNYPSLFQLNRLVESGAIDPDTAAKWAEWNLYGPEVVKALHTFWSGQHKATPDKNVTKAQTHLWNALHGSYVAYKATVAAVTTGLTELGIAADAQTKIVALWTHERDLTRRDLPATAIRKALNAGIFTQDEAERRLIEQGMSKADADVYLKEN